MYREIFVRLHVKYHDICDGNHNWLDACVYIYIYIYPCIDLYIYCIYISSARSYEILGNMFGGILGYMHIMCHVLYHRSIIWITICSTVVIHPLMRWIYGRRWPISTIRHDGKQPHPIKYDSTYLVEYHNANLYWEEKTLGMLPICTVPNNRE